MNESGEILDFDSQTEYLRRQKLLELQRWLSRALRHGNTSPLRFLDRDAAPHEVIVRHHHNTRDTVFQERFMLATVRLLRRWTTEPDTNYLHLLLLVAGGVGAAEAFDSVLTIAASKSLRDKELSGRNFHVTALQVAVGFGRASEDLKEILKRDIIEDPPCTAICYTGLAMINPRYAVLYLATLTRVAVVSRDLVNYDFVLMNVLGRYDNLPLVVKYSRSLVQRLDELPISCLQLFAMTLVSRFNLTIEVSETRHRVLVYRRGKLFGEYPNTRDTKAILHLLTAGPRRPIRPVDFPPTVSSSASSAEEPIWLS